MVAIQTVVHQVGRQVGTDERKLEPAHQKAEIEQQESTVRKRLFQRSTQADLNRRCAASHLVAQGECKRQRHGAEHAKHHQGADPAQTGQQPLRHRHHEELSQPADTARDPKRPAALLRRRDAAQRTVDHPESRARQPDPDAYPGAQREGCRRCCRRHGEQPEAVEEQPGNDRAARPEAVCDHAGDRLRHPPHQILDRDRKSESLTRPTLILRNRQQEDALRMPDAEHQSHDDTAGENGEPQHAIGGAAGGYVS
jgi:hypothetical protein